MGWLTICRGYPVNVDRREVYADFNYQIQHDTWEEGGHALDGITWLWDYSPLKNADAITPHPVSNSSTMKQKHTSKVPSFKKNAKPIADLSF